MQKQNWLFSISPEIQCHDAHIKKKKKIKLTMSQRQICICIVTVRYTNSNKCEYTLPNSISYTEIKKGTVNDIFSVCIYSSVYHMLTSYIHLVYAYHIYIMSCNGTQRAALETKRSVVRLPVG